MLKYITIDPTKYIRLKAFKLKSALSLIEKYGFPYKSVIKIIDLEFFWNFRLGSIDFGN